MKVILSWGLPADVSISAPADVIIADLRRLADELEQGMDDPKFITALVTFNEKGFRVAGLEIADESEKS